MKYIANFDRNKNKDDPLNIRPSTKGALAGASLGSVGGSFLGVAPQIIGIGVGGATGYAIGKTFKKDKNKKYDF